MRQYITKSAVVWMFVLIPALATADASSYQERTFEGGSWRYALTRDAKPTECYGTVIDTGCITNVVVARNLSNQTLECQASLQYSGVNDEGISNIRKPAVLKPQAIRSLISDVAKPDLAVAAYDVSCTPRRPIDKSQLTPNCKKTLDTSRIDLKTLYPPASRRESEEGPVILEFSLTRTSAAPSDIKVVGSSLYPRLDEAAIGALSKAVGSTECERATYLMELDFELKD